MRQLLTTCFSVVFIFVIGQYSIAQSGKPHFKHITVDDGLSSDKIVCITQDKTGFMWFGTEVGLIRYDGNSFEIFKNSPNDKYSINNNYVKCIYEDPRDGNLWIGTNHGLNYFNKNDYKFYNDFKLPRNDSSLLKRTIHKVLRDHRQNLWIGTSVGLYVYFNKADAPVKSQAEAAYKILDKQQVDCIFEDSKQNLWIGTRSGLNLFDWQTKTFKPYFLIEKTLLILNIYEDTRGNIWVTTWDNGVFVIRKDGVKHYCTENNYLKSNKVHAVVEDDDGNMYLIVKDGGGLYHLNCKTDNITILAHDINDPYSVSSATLTAGYKDKFGNIWLGTGENGIDLIDKNRKPFLHYKANFQPNGLQSEYVRAIFQDSQSNIWIGTKDGGCLSRFNPTTGTFIHYANDPKNPNSLGTSSVMSIGEATPDMLLVGTYDRGLDLLDKRTGRFYHFINEPGNRKSIVDNMIFLITKDRFGTIWVATSNKLQKFDLKTKSFESLGNIGYIKGIVDYSDEELYFAGTNGFTIYNRLTNEIVNFTNKDASGIDITHITGIVEDSRKNLWIATFGAGLVHFDTKTKIFKAYTTNDGLASNLTCAIQIDNHDNLWISSTNGLSKFDPATGKFRNYSVADGLQGKEFGRLVSCKTKEGYMLFGGNNGFNYFYPDSIKDNPIIPKIVITGFKIFNKPVSINTKNSPLKQDISVTKELVLNYKQSVFTFDFAALNFTSAENNKYAYKLEPLEREWNYMGNIHTATYTSLPAGVYTFKVKASNNDGLWNEQPSVITIQILPPPWKSWWAYLLYLLILGTLSYFLIKHYNIRRNFKTQMQLSRIEKEKQQELNQVKLQFFTNISHEFKTPLNLILSPLKNLRKINFNDENVKHDVDYIHRNTLRLQNLINQLMDFRKIENKNLDPIYKEGNIVKFMQGLLSIFQPIAEENKISIAFKSDSDSILTFFDFDKTEKILYNLFSNAVKFTPENGKITVTLSLSDGLDKSNLDQDINFKTSRFVAIRVSNTGQAIDAEKLPHIFETYYHIDRPNTFSQPSTGLGLAFTKELIGLLNGRISVTSNQDETSFTVMLPYIGNQKKISNAQLETGEQTVFEYTQQQVEILKAEKTGIDGKAFNFKGETILIVEDDMEMRKFLFNSFAKNYKVFAADNGLAGLDLAHKINPALIVSDIVMPQMSGIELCNKIKTDVSTSHIPVILLTGDDTDKYKIMGMETGADGYIEKPFDLEFLKLQVNNIIKTREAVRKAFATKISPEPENITITSTDEQFVIKAITMVEENIDNPDFDVEAFVKAMGVGRTLLYQKIKALTDLTINEFIINIRLKRAAQLLRESDLTITEIAFHVGFNSPSYFGAYFKKHFKQTPSDFASEYKTFPYKVILNIVLV